MARITDARGQAPGCTIVGFVLRAARESTRHTQASMAEALGIDLTTWQGWETGRRPLAHVKVGTLADLRHRLLAMDADPHVLRLLDPALDADRVISSTIRPGAVARHPLADWVHTRDTADMIAWALDGTVPPGLAHRSPPRRRGPAAPAPLLPVPDRGAFFSRLREMADSAVRTGEGGLLLHRQALYLCSYEQTPEAIAWTGHALHVRRDLITVRGWSPHWATARSTAVALSRLGDTQPLVDFIDRAMAGDDDAEAANLTYWAHWLGASREPQANDAFMRRRPTSWEPVCLLRGFSAGLRQAPAYVDLYAHSLWALLTSHRWLPLADSALTDELRSHIVHLLDHDTVSPRSRRELTALHYLLRETRA
ncbi:helix-turn-helix transcriptional regulator [Streptomyces griseoviridis]|uniref:helix-turn-helix transcriptional regulator n=1 Tax=Streptomyces griseoviridis TaxID=45398 RepID=UPI00344A2B90